MQQQRRLLGEERNGEEETRQKDTVLVGEVLGEILVAVHQVCSFQ